LSLVEKPWALPVGLSAAFLLVAMIGSAWLGDDCFFTLRTVDNFLHGHGLRFNVGDRVQAYTHPLWMLVLSAAIGVTRDYYYTTLILSLLLATGAVGLLLRGSTPAAMLALLAGLGLSRAFVDYSTSGLENALGYLLAALILCQFVARQPAAPSLTRTALLVALSACNRLDTVLLFAAPLLWHALEVLRAAPAGRRAPALMRVAGALAVGFTPLIAWELFSLLYYGFPFPNTAYAKLGSGVPRADLALQGLRYLQHSLVHDPFTLLLILTACLVIPWRARAISPFVLGLLAYLAYVVAIGGDFMAGRFLALPLLIALGLLTRLRLHLPARAPAWAVPVLTASFAVPLHHMQLPFDEHMIHSLRALNADGIADERIWFWRQTGLWRANARLQPPERPNDDYGVDHHAGDRQLIVTARAVVAYWAGPETRVVDQHGLSDALLARLPARDRIEWRVGHFERALPSGYLETLASGKNQLADPHIARFYGLLREVTSGPLLDPRRVRLVLELNLGRHDALIERAAPAAPSRLLSQGSKPS
jgi:arabinofuranosyltransferase